MLVVFLAVHEDDKHRSSSGSHYNFFAAPQVLDAMECPYASHPLHKGKAKHNASLSMKDANG
jgi:hypothetical protein